MNKTLHKIIDQKGIEIAGLVLSVFALLFSVKSCSDSSEAITISRNQSMAFIQVTDAELIEPIDSSSFIQIRLTLKNLGQVPAQDVRAEFDYSVQIGDFETDGNATTRKDIGSIGQGFEKIVILKSNKRNIEKWKTSYRIPDVLCFYGTVFYKDKLNTNLENKVDWCYELKLDNEKVLKIKKLDPSESTKFKSKYSQQNQ
ncbi:hypothetical protein [Flavobacterium koreense]